MVYEILISAVLIAFICTLLILFICYLFNILKDFFTKDELTIELSGMNREKVKYVAKLYTDGSVFYLTRINKRLAFVRVNYAEQDHKHCMSFREIMGYMKLCYPNIKFTEYTPFGCTTYIYRIKFLRLFKPINRQNVFYLKKI